MELSQTINFKNSGSNNIIINDKITVKAKEKAKRSNRFRFIAGFLIAVLISSVIIIWNLPLKKQKAYPKPLDSSRLPSKRCPKFLSLGSEGSIVSIAGTLTFLAGMTMDRESIVVNVLKYQDDEFIALVSSMGRLPSDLAGEFICVEGKIQDCSLLIADGDTPFSCRSSVMTTITATKTTTRTTTTLTNTIATPTPLIQKRKVLVVYFYYADTEKPSLDVRNLTISAFANPVTGLGIRNYFHNMSYGIVSLEGYNSSELPDYTNWIQSPLSITDLQGVMDWTNFLKPHQVNQSYDHYMYVPSEVANDTDFLGMGEQPGKWTFYSNYKEFLGISTANHELGHNLNFWHAASLDCKENDLYVPISYPGNCTFSEYGDYYADMGWGFYHVQAYHRERAKWINNNHLLTAVKNGTFRIDTIDTFDPNGKKLALRFYLSNPFVLDKKIPLRYYYLELHTCKFVDPNWGNPCGDNYLKPAIYIRLNSNTDQMTFLIRQKLKTINETFVDPVNRLLFKLKEINSTSAIIQIDKS